MGMDYLGSALTSGASTVGTGLMKLFNQGSSPEEIRRNKWMESMFPYAQRWSQSTGIPPEVYLAILASETNYGKADTYFGIKGKGTAGSSQQDTFEIINGQRVNINAGFAKYNNPDEAHDAFVNLISTSPRYKAAWEKYLENGNWGELLAGINSAGYATDPNWASNVANIASGISKKTGNSLTSGSAPGARTIGFGSSGAVNTKPTGKTVGNLPNPDDYYEDNGDGTWTWNSQAYYEDYNNAVQAQESQQNLQLNPIATYMSQVMAELGAQIEAGNMDISKATTIANTRLTAYKSAMDVLNSDAFKFGSPVGSEYVSGRGPDDYATRVLGLNPRSTAGSTVIDPLREAMDTYNQTKTAVDAVKTPTVPNLSGDYRSQIFGAVGAGGGGAPPGPAPTNNPPPTPVGGAVGYTNPAALSTDPNLAQALANFQREGMM